MTLITVTNYLIIKWQILVAHISGTEKHEKLSLSHNGIDIT